ncbi:Golgi SNAP receptor complex member 1 isoform X2 [Neocloeon triangulifer]|uniref:Golgi SNAP receptor complex member 1 isoform X2 n=1 Tax=Neocloeon triangulifer TaxID=2078957 RepID=UPI00286F6EE4|nr:Golgi SNAP receptor complex member 1 isoform X2 [Neocloeon triangulifer]
MSAATTAGPTWEGLRKEARQLENEIDLKLVGFSKLGTGLSANVKSDSDNAPLLGPDHVFESMALEIESLLEKLSNLNDQMAEFSSAQTPSAALLHTLQRHREILQDYKQEFRKTQANFTARREREDLLKSVRKDIDNFKTSSGLNRRMDFYLKENDHIRNSDRLLDDQISIAVETRDNLVAQRVNFKRLQTRFNDLSNRFPLINSLLQRVNLRKRRDSLILGLVIGGCMVLLLLYAFRVNGSTGVQPNLQ